MTNANLTREYRRYNGRKAPFRMYVVIGIFGLATNVVFYLVFGEVSGKLAAMDAILLGGGLFSYAMSLSSNYVSFQEEHVVIKVWLLVPMANYRVPYTKIARVEADDTGGNVGIWFVDSDGDTNATEIVLAVPSLASAVKDEILARQRGDSPPAPELTIPSTDELAAIVPIGSGKRTFAVETQVWMRTGAVIVLVIFAVGIAVTEGPLDPLSWAFGVGFCVVMGALFYAVDRSTAHLTFRDERIELRAGLGGDHQSIDYENIIEAKGRESGWLCVKYLKKPTLGLGGGENETGIRVKPHSQVHMIAAALNVARDRAKQAANTPKASN